MYFYFFSADILSCVTASILSLLPVVFLSEPTLIYFDALVYSVCSRSDNPLRLTEAIYLASLLWRWVIDWTLFWRVSSWRAFASCFTFTEE